MQVLLIRHAEKQNSFGSHNPPLSPKGLLQAENLLQIYQENKLFKPDQLWGSSKIRTQQTLDQLANKIGKQIQILPELEERKSTENRTDFQKRVQNVINKIEKSQQNIMLCSHMDWLEEALNLIPLADNISNNLYSHWPSGAYFHFQFQDGLWVYQQSGQI